MSSGLINRYSAVSGKPIVEIEKAWRTIKREFTDNGKKKDYNGCIRELRERLGIKLSEGRQAFLYGTASVEVLAETPDWALVQVEDIETVENSDLRRMLFTSKGIITVPFEQLSNEFGGPPLAENSMMAPSASTPSISAAATTGSKTSFPVSTQPNRDLPDSQSSKDYLNGIVNFRGRKAIVISNIAGRARIRFLDTNEEADASEGELKADPTSMESIATIWNSLDSSLNEVDKQRMFESILKFEYNIAYLPKKIREDLDLMTKAVSDNKPSKTLETDPEKPGYLHRVTPGDEQAGDVEKLKFDNTDWGLIFDITKEPDEQSEEEREPMPEPPKRPTKDDEGTAQREGEPPNKDIKPASDGEVHDMLHRMKATRESYEKGTKLPSWSERTKINIDAEAKKVGPLLDSKNRGISEKPKSVFEKNVERGKKWGDFLDE
jgi:hypothetical protein